MKVHISNVAYELLVAAASVKELQLVKLAYTSDTSLFLYRYDDYMANKRLRMVYALIISPYTYKCYSICNTSHFGDYFCSNQSSTCFINTSKQSINGECPQSSNTFNSAFGKCFANSSPTTCGTT